MVFAVMYDLLHITKYKVHYKWEGTVQSMYCVAEGSCFCCEAAPLSSTLLSTTYKDPPFFLPSECQPLAALLWSSLTEKCEAAVTQAPGSQSDRTRPCDSFPSSASTKQYFAVQLLFCVLEIMKYKLQNKPRYLLNYQIITDTNG